MNDLKPFFDQEQQKFITQSQPCIILMLGGLATGFLIVFAFFTVSVTFLFFGNFIGYNNYYCQDISNVHCHIIDNKLCDPRTCTGNNPECAVGVIFQFNESIYSDRVSLSGRYMRESCNISNCCSSQMDNATDLICDVIFNTDGPHAIGAFNRTIHDRRLSDIFSTLVIYIMFMVLLNVVYTLIVCCGIDDLPKSIHKNEFSVFLC